MSSIQCHLLYFIFVFVYFFYNHVQSIHLGQIKTKPKGEETVKDRISNLKIATMRPVKTSVIASRILE